MCQRPMAKVATPDAGPALLGAQDRHKLAKSQQSKASEHCSRSGWPKPKEKKLVASRWHNQLPKVILGVKFTDEIEVVRSAQTAAA
jgi:hypothetical protein